MTHQDLVCVHKVSDYCCTAGDESAELRSGEISL